MPKIEEIDKNLLVEQNIKTENIKIYNAFEKPFEVFGHSGFEKQGISRIPENIAKNVNDGVYTLRCCAAGIRVRFSTDSNYIAIRAEMPHVCRSSHFPLTGTAGFELYTEFDEKTKYIKTFIPEYDMKDVLAGAINIQSKGKMHEYTLYLPLYSPVTKLNIILDHTANITSPRPYKISKPIVFYGSSITQGGCACKPGNVYSAILSRKFDFDFINLGFSGSAKGEKEIAEYISELDMSAFVYDYDHNAPSYLHLEETHEKMYQIIRKKHPDIPIICMTRPYPQYDSDDRRLQVIKKTVEKGISQGDTNLYFLNTANEIENIGIANEATVDGCHPNDLGFYFMSKSLEKIFNEILNR